MEKENPNNVYKTNIKQYLRAAAGNEEIAIITLPSHNHLMQTKQFNYNESRVQEN